MNTVVAPDQGTVSAIVNCTGLELVAPVTVKRGMDCDRIRSASALARSQSASPAPALARSVESSAGVSQMRGCGSAWVVAGARRNSTSRNVACSHFVWVIERVLSKRPPLRRPDEVQMRPFAHQGKALEAAASVAIEYDLARQPNAGRDFAADAERRQPRVDVREVAGTAEHREVCLRHPWAARRRPRPRGRRRLNVPLEPGRDVAPAVAEFVVRGAAVLDEQRLLAELVADPPVADDRGRLI